MRKISIRVPDPKTAAHAAHAIAVWETDGGASPEPAASGSGGGTIRIIRLALIWPYDAAVRVVAGIRPVDEGNIAGIVADGYRVLATVRDHPPYTHIIGARGGQDYLATLATVWANPANALPAASRSA
jgi:hypothetical protein